MMISVEDSFAAWRNDPRYIDAYVALEDEFSRATASLRLRISFEPPAAR
jgi:hypothetical protein